MTEESFFTKWERVIKQTPLGRKQDRQHPNDWREIAVQQHAEIERLRAALKPFAEVDYIDEPEIDALTGSGAVERAREALGLKRKEQQ